MAKKSGPVVPPDEALPGKESNLYLAKFKSSLCKRWSLTSTGTLYEINDLAVFLWALERNNEALAVANSIATTIPTPPPLPAGRFNYSIWCPATVSHALIVYLPAAHAQANASRAAILADCGIARDNPKFIADNVAEARRLTTAPVGQDTIKWECQSLARALGKMVLYCELAKAGDSHFQPHSEAADAIIPQLLSKLGSRLQSAK